MEPLRRRALEGVWLAIGAAVLLAAAWMMVGRAVAVIATPVLIAGLLVYLADPAITKLEQFGVRRGLATAGLIAATVGVVAAAAWVFVPILTDQAADLEQELPVVSLQLEETLNNVGERLPVDLPAVDLSSERVAATLTEWLTEDGVAADQVLAGAAAVGGWVVSAALAATLAPVLAAYVLVDWPRIRRVLSAATPPQWRGPGGELVAELDRSLGKFLRGQLILGGFVGAGSMVLLGALGVPFWAVIALVAGVTNIIPFIGPLIGGAAAVLSALLFGDGVGQALLAGGGFALIQQVESSVVGPMVHAKGLRLHPALVLLSVTVGGSLLGIIGMLVAVPVAAAVLVVVRFAADQAPHLPVLSAVARVRGTNTASELGR